ncbi:DUF1134 domain-containing protein [Sphingomonas abietis]|uniref:DUF1134 domain-containing protein n=1 Tax=Sphingomonas abietis TaxID=3012344 RepID=A0ABY7NL79_9SPHN|nr:DUF1134 domain-containing protein [Sphingomonas abietis]WBO22284.1 DUF1134 domain-containing protein [Sphingomonas abietis]
MTSTVRRIASAACIAALAGLAAQPVGAQIRTVDPSSSAAHSDLAPAGSGQPETSGQPDTASAPSAPPPESDDNAPPPPAGSAPDRYTPPATNASRAPSEQTYQEHDVLDAAEGVFGRGAEGLAKMIEHVLKDQGQPTAYIAGREASGAFAIGLKYGSGVLHHKIEGDRPVYWTGPTLGFDIGGNASKEFILVYNLYDSQDLYHRFPAAEGTAYFIGGFTASYLRRGDIVLIPIRLGVGWRLGANVGYMKFTPQSKIMPF